MTPLKDALLKATEWDERDAHSQALIMGYDSNYPTEHKAFEYGSRNQHARLQPLLKALGECVVAWNETLDRYKFTAVPYSELTEYGQGAQDAIAQIEGALESEILKLDKVLREMGFE